MRRLPFLAFAIALWVFSASSLAQMNTEGDPKPSLEVQGAGNKLSSSFDAKFLPLGPSPGGKAPDQELSIESFAAMASSGTKVKRTFEGFGFDDNRTETGFLFIPPDPIGAAGKDRVIAVVNTMIEARSQTGSLLWRDSLRDFFAPLSPATFTFDPKIVYDHYTDRFVVVTLEVVFGSTGTPTNPGNQSRIFLAVSKNGRPRTATAADWRYLAIDAKTTIIFGFPGPTPFDTWADYPGFELDEEVVYVTANMFTHFGGGAGYGGVRLWIVHKSGFYDGGSAVVTKHNPYATGGIATTTMPTLIFGGKHGDDVAAGAGPGIGTYLVSYSGLSDGVDEFVQVVRVDNPTTTPTFTQEFVLLGNIETFTAPTDLPDAPQPFAPGCTAPIEVNDRRALDAVWRDDSLWMVMTIKPNFGPDINQTSAYWVRLDTSAVPGPITTADQGGIGGEDIAPGTFTYFPSVAVNRENTAGFGFSASAPTVFAGAYATGRSTGLAPGTVETSGLIKAGEACYFRTFGGTRNRWGDYSGISLDWANDKEFWAFNEFADTRGTPTGSPAQDGRWGTAWGRFKIPGNGDDDDDD